MDSSQIEGEHRVLYRELTMGPTRAFVQDSYIALLDPVHKEGSAHGQGSSFRAWCQR